MSEFVASVSPQELDRRQGDAWTAREVIDHIADTELVEGVRLRRIIAEDNPTLPPIDKEQHARRLHLNRKIETSVEAFSAVVMANAALAERLTEREWARAGTQGPTATYSVEDWLRRMSQHAHDHVRRVMGADGQDVCG